MTAHATPPHEITRLLQQWSDGDPASLDLLVPLVYTELRRIAAHQLRGERAGHSVAPTALVHELYLRLVGQRTAVWQNRAQFFAVAARLMRRILVDQARARNASKRGGNVTLMSLDTVPDQRDQQGTVADVLAIDEALERLGARDADQEHLVELRFFAGLTIEEAAHVLGRSPRTVKREWRLARAWLYRELSLEPRA